MPFRKGYEGVYDQVTLTQLQDIFEFVWLAVADSLSCAEVSREYIAHRIIAAHEAGLVPEAIKNKVILELTQPDMPLKQGESRDAMAKPEDA